jgi:hypothetical protein
MRERANVSLGFGVLAATIAPVAAGPDAANTTDRTFDHCRGPPRPVRVFNSSHAQCHPRVGLRRIIAFNAES